jgi:predicted nucleic acid-binding protein
MKKILVDSSVWIDYFGGRPETEALSELLDNNRVCVNALILSELIPYLRQKREDKLVSLLQTVHRVPINIEWDEIISMQCLNLRHGIHKVGIPDLIILQNALQHHLEIFSLDKHFSLMKPLFRLNLAKLN